MPRALVVLCLAVAIAMAADKKGVQAPKGPATKAAAKAAAKGGPPAHPQLERLMNMSPADRKKALDALPPQRRQNVERRLEQYSKMTPQQRQQLQNAATRLQSLPPERQARVRQIYNRFNQIPEERKPMVRQELNSLQRMSPEEREEHMNSDEFRNKYTPHEKQVLSDLSKAFDPEED